MVGCEPHLVGRSRGVSAGSKRDSRPVICDPKTPSRRFRGARWRSATRCTASYFDTAVNGYLMQATGTDIRTLDAYGVVAETGCRFLRELRFPDDVEAGLRVTRLGTSSIVYEIGLFQGASDAPAAVGRFVHVYVSGAERTVTPVPDVIRAALEPLAV